MSLPTASQNTQYYLQAGYGLACAVASAEMALFGEAFAEAASSFAVGSVWGVVFCATIHLGRRLFGSIRLGRRMIHCGCRLLQYDPFGVSSFAVQSVGGTVFSVQSVGGTVFGV
jgi:hypothetical protein